MHYVWIFALEESTGAFSILHHARCLGRTRSYSCRRSAYTEERPPRLAETDRRPSEARFNAQARNADTPAAMTVSTMRIPTCDAARRTGERGRVL